MEVIRNLAEILKRYFTLTKQIAGNCLMWNPY